MTGFLHGTAILIILSVFAAFAGPEAQAARYAAIVVNADTGEILYARNINKKRYPASLAKMMTLYLTFEALTANELALDTKMRVSRRAAGQAPSRLGLKAGQRLRVDDAVLALITKSANDAATVLAEAIAGSEINFAKRMTAKARALGMSRTEFRNASGLPNRRQRSTAKDLSLLARALINDFPEYYPYFATLSFTYKSKTYKNHNNLLAGFPGTDGIKTGYTRASGFNLAASVERGEHRLIGIVLGGKTQNSRDRHMRKILNVSFARLAAQDAIGRERPAEDGGNRIQSVEKPVRPRINIPQPPSQKAFGTDSAVEAAWSPDTSWGIQVGAFERYTAAQQQIDVAARAQPNHLKNKRVLIIPAEGDSGGLYRARVAGFMKDEARAVCALLIRTNIDCVPVPPQRLDEDPWLLQ